MAEIVMPKLGDAMDEGKIVQWLKKVGDSVQPEEAVLEIETDKTNVEVAAETAGILHRILFAAGSSVPVGSPVAVIGDGPPPADATTPSVAVPAARPEPASNGIAPAPAPLPSPPLPAPVPVAATGPFRPYGESQAGQLPENLGGSASVLGEPSAASPAAPERVKATPLARAIASANGIDLTALRTDGPVTRADVEAALAAPRPAVPAAAPADEIEVQEYNAMRRTIARRLTESKQSTPHFYVTVEIDMEALLSLREQLNAGVADDAKISVNDCVIKAVSAALLENPNVNSRFDDNKRVVTRSHHIGFGVSVADGLIVPVVRHCQSRTLRQIAKDTKPLIEKARAGKLAPADYTGGTFTISNLGAMADVENFAAIINPGEGAILAVAGTRTVPAVIDGQIVPRRRMKVTLSADHRVIDGADGAKFLLSLKKVMESPLQMLA